MAIGSFQQCFDDYMNHQGSLTAFSCVVCKDEHAVNLRAQRIVEFVVENDQNSVEYADDTDGFALQSYHMLVEPEFREACRRRAWRGIPKPRLWYITIDLIYYDNYRYIRNMEKVFDIFKFRKLNKLLEDANVTGNTKKRLDMEAIEKGHLLFSSVSDKSRSNFDKLL